MLHESDAHRLNEFSAYDDENFPLLECALHISKLLTPSFKTDLYLVKYDDLFDQFKSHCPPDPLDGITLQDKINALRYFFIEIHHFFEAEESFFDLDAHNFFKIFDHKEATPLTLAILFLSATRFCQWRSFYPNFPIFSLIGLEEKDQRLFFDPSQNCQLADSSHLRQMLKTAAGRDKELNPHYFDPVPAKTLIIRYIQPIKSHFIRCENYIKAIEMLSACLCLDPKADSFLRERALLHARCKNFTDAKKDMGLAIQYCEDPEKILQMQTFLKNLKPSNHSLHIVK